MTAAPLHAVDALGRPVTLAAPPARIVSLVPSLTEALFAFGLGGRISGVTRYCVEPAAGIATVPKVGGTKDPDLAAIRALAPDLVIASAEENVREHVEALVGDGLTVYVSLPSTVRHALEEMHDVALLCGANPEATPWLAEAAQRVAEREADRRPPVRYFCPIWRRPWMAAGPETYMSDLLRVCGGESVAGAGAARYHTVDLAEVMAAAPEVVLLPSEPYPFAERHRAELLAFSDAPAVRNGRVHLVDGQLVTWYGPRTGRAITELAALLRWEG